MAEEGRGGEGETKEGERRRKGGKVGEEKEKKEEDRHRIWIPRWD